MKKYNVVIEKGSDGIYVGSVPTMPGCHSDGLTIDELLKNLKDAILLWEEVNNNDFEPLELVGIKTLEI